MCCWGKPVGVKPRCPREAAVGSDSNNGIRHQRALSPRLSMMMMMKYIGVTTLTFGATWRHQSHDHRTRRGHFPIGGQWWPCAYFARVRATVKKNFLHKVHCFQNSSTVLNKILTDFKETFCHRLHKFHVMLQKWQIVSRIVFENFVQNIETHQK